MGAVRVLSHEAAVHAGVRHFERRATLDMEPLARELAVSRATLYRTVGSRDALLGDVLCAIGRRIVDGIVSDPELSGVDGVIEISRRFALALDAAGPLRLFTAHEPETAHRILLTTTGQVHALAVDIQRRLFLQIGGVRAGDARERTDLPARPLPARPLPARPLHGDRGGAPESPRSSGSSGSCDIPTPRVPASRDDALTDRAFLYIRILESVLYGPMLAGRRPDFTLAEPALRAVVA